MVPHIVPISWRQIKNRIPLDFARLQATNEPCLVGSGTLLGSSVWSEVRAGLAAQSARLCVPAHRGGAHVRGDHGRRAGGPDPDLARRAGDRAAGTATDRRRDEVGGRDRLPAGQPGGRRLRAGARTAADRRPAHAGAASRCGGGRPRDRASLPGLGHHQAGVRVSGADGRALEILDAARMLGDAGSWVFNTRGDMPPDAKQFRRLLERCGIACVPHGFRSSLRSVRPRRDDHPTEGSLFTLPKGPFSPCHFHPPSFVPARPDGGASRGHRLRPSSPTGRPWPLAFAPPELRAAGDQRTHACLPSLSDTVQRKSRRI